MFNYRVIIIFLLIAVQQYYAQLNAYPDSLKVNSSIHEFTNEVGNFHLSNLSQPKILNGNSINELRLLLPKLSWRYNEFISLKIPPIQHFNSLQNPQDSIYQFAQFKASLNKLLEIEYRKVMKYDLGEIGIYLGLSKKIIAIILGIFSLL